MNNNCVYTDCQMSRLSRHQNNIVACRIVKVDSQGLELETPSKQTIRIYPKDLEIFDYQIGMYVDIRLSKQNGTVTAAERIGMTPTAFIP